MVIQNEIDIELWEAIKKNYESENYTGAILDTIFKLTDTIRNKTGLEGDGASLIGQAFGGDNPKIKLNKLQTDSEKNMQKGMQDILRGIYTAIRNPRSHDIIHDKKEDADAIICFVNYLLSLIDKSKLSFEVGQFLNKVFDPYYVRNVEYSKLLIQEIPKRQRADIAISTILNRKRDKKGALEYFLEALFNQLNDAELSRVYTVISDELRLTIDKEDIRILIHICPGKYWDMVDEVVRLRVEEILYDDISNAIYDAVAEQCGNQGWLATWITVDHLKSFKDLSKWTRKVVDFLTCEDENLIAYINTFYWNQICKANKTNITYPLKAYLKSGLTNGDKAIIEKLSREIVWDKDHPWWEVFKDELKQYPDIKLEEFIF